jgi:uncharacterized damage-inducible protein DinB
MRLSSFGAVCTLFALPLAQAADWKTTFAKHWAISAAFTVAVAEAMPADGYSYIPPSTVEPKERTFAGLMVHIGQANVNYFSRASGVKGPAKPDGEDKATVMKYLQDTNDYCAKTLEGITEEQLAKMSGPEGRQLSGMEALWSAFTHAAHTRGQTEVYLRLKNVKPPDYKF